MQRRVLMIAFHFPPSKGSSGLQRTLNFVRHLPEHGWTPRLLTVMAHAHPAVSDEQLSDIPAGLKVIRAPSLDVSRHLAIAGRYPGFLALPDRWSSWKWAGIPLGLAQCLAWRPDVIWSTYPIVTANVIAHRLASITGLPWVADLRDSMSDESFPPEPNRRRSVLRVERATVKGANTIIFTSPGARRMYAERYPDVPAERWSLIPNGYDEQAFAAAGALQSTEVTGLRPRHLLHSGLLDPADRDPRPFLRAIAELKRSGAVSAARLRITLRATGHNEMYAGAVAQLGISDIVVIGEVVSYATALAEMLAADGLLVFQGPTCNHQIPAKVYEYLRAGPPLLAFTDRGGDTAALLRASGYTENDICDPAAQSAIAAALKAFLARLEDGTSHHADPAYVRSLSRQHQVGVLAKILDRVARPRA
jgi:glycosyltransferase involved in cell wall biosynthesis